jgi:hypothetical protein
MLELGSLEADAMPTICRGFPKCISQKIEKVWFHSQLMSLD